MGNIMDKNMEKQPAKLKKDPFEEILKIMERYEEGCSIKRTTADVKVKCCEDE